MGNPASYVSGYFVKIKYTSRRRENGKIGTL
jgi:hypothetical protein